jgi:NAD/NADP transhydrogenase beta subunit
VKYQLATAALALAFVLAALASGEHRRGAVLGAAISGVTALGSIVAMARLSRRGTKPVKAALAVMTVTFLVRILLVGLGVVAVVHAGESVLAFVTAFFVSYFVFVAVEGAFVHTLSRGTGPTA